MRDLLLSGSQHEGKRHTFEHCIGPAIGVSVLQMVEQLVQMGEPLAGDEYELELYSSAVVSFFFLTKKEASMTNGKRALISQ